MLNNDETFLKPIVKQLLFYIYKLFLIKSKITASLCVKFRLKYRICVFTPYKKLAKINSVKITLITLPNPLFTIRNITP